MKLFLVAGEKSGDNLGGNLIKALKGLTDVEVSGTGGSLLREAGQKQFYDIKEMDAIGIGQALKKIPFLLKVKDRLVEELKNDRPDAVILVDYPGFNLRFAEYVKQLDIPVIFYVSPTFWAWNYKRVHKLRKFCDLVLCIYPFEEELLKKEGVNAVYIGNPLKKQINFRCSDREEFLKKGNFSGEKRIIGLLPGSRRREVQALLPVMVSAARQMTQYDFVVGAADTVDESKVREMIKGTNIRLATNLTHDIMKYSDLLWVCSGTATLEAAIIGTPMILMYKTGLLTYSLGKMLYKQKYVGMPNLIMKRSVIPELLQGDASVYGLVVFTGKIEANYRQVREDLKAVGSFFGDIDAQARGAEEILSFTSSMKRGN